MSDISSTPAPMEGHGGYNRSSSVQAAGSSPALPLFEQAAAVVALPGSSEAIVIADYGSSEGHNSLAPLPAAIRVLRSQTGPERAISVVHTDLPGNDFSALFETLASDPSSYLRGDTALFPSAAGRSFYEQILPSSSVTLGWSSWSVQWLSRVPGPIPDQVQVGYSRDAAARAAYAQQAAEDWRNFLASRGAELRPGGKLVVLTMALRDDGDFGYRAAVETLYEALLDLVGDGLISAEEMHSMAIPTFARSRADLMAPFSGSGCFAGLSVDHLNIFEGEDRIWEDFQRDRNAHRFGARWAAFSRALVFPTLAQALDGGLDDRRAPAFMDKLEAANAARLAEKPEPMVIPLASMVLVKEGC
jgi:S-adenosylmethionine-dependent carboxyl methyltransferase